MAYKNHTRNEENMIIIDITKEEAIILKETIQLGLNWIQLAEEKTEKQKHMICVLDNLKEYLEEKTK